MHIVAAGEKHGQRIWDCEWQDQGKRFHRRLRAQNKGQVLEQIAALCASSAGTAVPWSVAALDFIKAKRAEGKSDEYLRSVDECLAWITPRLSPIVQQTTLTEVAKAVADKTAEASARTGNKHFQVLRAVARWLQSQGRAQELPFLRFRPIPEKPKESRALPAVAISRYLQALPPHILEPVAFCAVAAIRTGAVCRISRADIREKVVAITEKAGKIRLLERDPWIDAILDRALARETRPDAQGSPLFATARGRRWAGPALLHAAQRVWKAAGLEKDMTIHELCRHGPATLAGAAGHEVDELRSYLGHSSRRTSERYVHRDEPTAARVRSEIAPALVGFLWAGDQKRHGNEGIGVEARGECACPQCGHKFHSLQVVTSKSMA